jgi:hypothetical protein
VRFETATTRLIVLSGNSREMTLKRAERLGGIGKYEYLLEQNLAQFGFEKGATGSSSIRDWCALLDREFTWPEDEDELHALAADFNRPLTGALGGSERAVSAGKALKPEQLERISQMITGLGEDADLRDLMAARGPELVRLMVDSGAWTERERPQFIDTATGGLSDEGKQFVERALRGTIVDDPKLMDRIPRSIMKKLDGSLGDMAAIAANPDYDMRSVLREALEAHAEIAQRATTVDSYLNQRGMFNTIRHPAVDVLVAKLAEPTAKVREAIHLFAQDAKFDAPGQATLGLIERPAPYKSFNAAFGANLTEQQYAEIVAKTGGKPPAEPASPVVANPATMGEQTPQKKQRTKKVDEPVEQQPEAKEAAPAPAAAEPEAPTVPEQAPAAVPEISDQAKRIHGVAASSVSSRPCSRTRCRLTRAKSVT